MPAVDIEPRAGSQDMRLDLGPLVGGDPSSATEPYQKRPVFRRTIGAGRDGAGRSLAWTPDQVVQAVARPEIVPG